jgi:hypothetical protein
MDLQELLDNYHVDYITEGHHHCTPTSIQVDCPYCSQGWKRWRMGLHKYRRSANCWVCGRHSFVETLAEITKESYSNLRKVLSLLYIKDKQEKKRGKLELPKYLGELLPAHRKYLENRGLNIQELAEVWQIKGIGPAPKLAWRIFIPITYRGAVVSWTTRAIGENQIRYINARPDQESISAKELLFGQDHARSSSVLVVEGPFDAMRIGKGAVATFGISFSKSQLRKIADYPRRTVCFDSEREAQIRARKLCDDLSMFPGETRNVVIKSGKDPGSASEKETQELRELIK